MRVKKKTNCSSWVACNSSTLAIDGCQCSVFAGNTKSSMIIISESMMHDNRSVTVIVLFFPDAWYSRLAIPDLKSHILGEYAGYYSGGILLISDFYVTIHCTSMRA